MIGFSRAAFSAAGLFAATILDAVENATTPVVELDPFTVEVDEALAGRSLSPLASGPSSYFGADASLAAIPRSVTVITPETQRAFDLRDFDDVATYGAGTARINYFGLPGIPFLRGSRAGVYFDGMLRAYQRNEMPTSFGSVEGLEIVKGPAPAYLTPTLVGGYVNLTPKAPYFDQARGSVEVSVGSDNAFSGQVDYGAPTRLGDVPVAYRLSLSAQDADRFYDDVRNDFVSLYAAAKAKFTGVDLTVGGEFYDFRSSEVPGVNRPTQRLIDHGEYVIGEPALLTASRWGGTVVRPLLTFPLSLSVPPALNALAIPGDVARERLPADLRAHLIDLNDPAQRAALYRSSKPSVDALLAEVGAPAQDAYVYTPAYFAAGGQVLTEKLSRRRILADPQDFADARNGLLFLDLTGTDPSAPRWETKLFVEALETDKASTYGFAFQSEQVVAALRSTLDLTFEPADTTLRLGTELRGSYANAVQDFDAEPFSRRDLSRDQISPNSVVWAGDRSPDGLAYWSTFGGASERSQLYQGALFVAADATPTDRLHLFAGARVENDWWYVSLPGEVDRASAALRDARDRHGEEILLSGSVGASFALGGGLHAYGSAQQGRSLAPGDGGTVSGPDSFTDTSLYEAGLKLVALDQQLFATLSAYEWEQSTFSNRDNEARPQRGQGLEAEATLTQGEHGWSLIAAGTAQRVEILTDAPGFGATFTPGLSQEEHWALNGGTLTATSDRDLSANPRRRLAGFPQLTSRLFLRYVSPQGWGLQGGPHWRDAYWHDIEHRLRLPSSLVWDLGASYRHRNWEFRLRVENLFDEAYWIGQDPVFAANTLVTPAPGRTWSVSVRRAF